MNDATISGVSACVFDAYGMLFDVHAAIRRGGTALGDSAQAVSDLWRQKQLEYAWLSDVAGRHMDFWQATSEALDYSLEAFGVEDPRLRDELLDLYLTLDAYPDVKPCLKILHNRDLKNAILSNGTLRMLEAAVNSAGIDTLLDIVLSIDEVGIYKPHAKAYQLAVDRLSLSPDQICFVSTNGWDAAGAAIFGFRVVWHNRFGRPQDRLPGEPAAVIESLDELPRLLDE